MSTKEITEYFNLSYPGDIRLKGSRIGIFQNQETLSKYMIIGMREEQRRNPPPVSEKLRQLRAMRKAIQQVRDESEISD
ncbi:MAG: hypothetical protein DSM107014_14835 [Gomphosphaeria aponina SAG 52.96 = DSM 107014]|uniref:Uncharacterized protein n=1 Tax=Gomphosphaeria aponina SAG 52.96 = DSM 107014 TaxID=1521640 RepID=A0A941GYX6_9CHRO|nr:hypothetical protein [Gomphosphaeria aponina SAG 52.96 = DSM 107014]